MPGIDELARLRNAFSSLDSELIVVLTRLLRRVDALEKAEPTVAKSATVAPDVRECLEQFVLDADDGFVITEGLIREARQALAAPAPPNEYHELWRQLNKLLTDIDPVGSGGQDIFVYLRKRLVAPTPVTYTEEQTEAAWAAVCDCKHCDHVRSLLLQILRGEWSGK